MSILSSVKAIHGSSTRIGSSISLVVMSVILFSSIFAQLYLLPYNPLNRIDQEENKVYAAKQFKIRINVDQDPIQRGDTQKIIVIVRDANTNDKISDALVRIAVDPHSGKIATGSSHTDDNGQTTFKVKISSGADTGTYDVAARATENGYAAKTVTTSFEVSSNKNNDNNNNGNSNNDHNGDNHNGDNKNNNNDDQVQVISQTNGCGNGKEESNVNCQNLANQIQGRGNAVNVIGVQSGGGDDGGGGDRSDSTHSHGSNNDGNGGQTGLINVQQSGTSSGGSGSNNGHGGHNAQSQAIGQANVCGNGKSASDVNCQNIANQIQSGDHNKKGNNVGKNQAIAQSNECGNGKEASNVNCQNLANQIQGRGNAVNVIGVQSDNNKGDNGLVSGKDENDKEFVKSSHNNNDTSSSGSE
jgi:hypothetical protein